MNPFMEPTVAQPDTAADWRRPRSCPPHAGERPHVRRPGRCPDPQRRSRPGRPASVPAEISGGVLRLIALLVALLLPGMTLAVDINSATPQQLQEIKGIGPKTAVIIIEERERGGRFESFADISERVKGIGPKKAAALQAAGLTVGDAGAADPASGRAAATPARRGR